MNYTQYLYSVFTKSPVLFLDLLTWELSLITIRSIRDDNIVCTLIASCNNSYP